jgi:N-sulfoglucosamine sulfohydrolase
MNRLDESVGLLLQELELSGKAENTVVIYLGDHGAQFSRGKCSNYEGGLKIPFIVKWPGVSKGNQSTNQLISTIDLLPTILEMTGVTVPAGLPGKSLIPVLMGKEETLRPFLFADGAGSAAFFYFPRRSVRNHRYKLIHNLLGDRDNPKHHWYATQKGVHFAGGTNYEEIAAAPGAVRAAYDTWKSPPKYELYDLKNDPNEFVDLSPDPEYREILAKMTKALATWQEITADPMADPRLLARYTREMDSVTQTYDGRNYARDPSFEWKYPEYFYSYIQMKSGDSDKSK